MNKVCFDITTSLDGYVAGPNDSPGNGLGDEGERLHEWIFALESWRRMHGREGGVGGPESEMLERRAERAGSTIVGRRMYDNAGGWGDEPPFEMPVIVLTSRVEPRRDCANGASFEFIDGAEAALERARELAGERDVALGGGADTIGQYLEMGVVDDFTIHVAPVLLGGGVRLFDGLGPKALDAVPTGAWHGEQAAHLEFEVNRS